MGKKEENKSEIFKNSSLIDFFYIDNGRVDSLMSQLHNGTLRGVIKTIATSEKSSKCANGNITVASAGYEHLNESGESAAEEYDPYHSKIIALLNDLNISPLEELPAQCDGKLVQLNAEVTIRDMQSIKSLMPIVLKNKSVLSLPKDEQFDSIMKFMNDMIQKMDDSIELSVKFNESSIKGTLQERGLSLAKSDISRTYGINLPGKWFILGILDSFSKNSAPVRNVSSVEDIIDSCANAMNGLYSESTYSIIPVLIYRIINY